MVSLSKQGPVRYGDGASRGRGEGYSPPPRFDDSVRVGFADENREGPWSITPTANASGSHPVPGEGRPIRMANQFSKLLPWSGVYRLRVEMGSLAARVVSVGAPVSFACVCLVSRLVVRRMNELHAEPTHDVCGFRGRPSPGWDDWDGMSIIQKASKRGKHPLHGKRGKRVVLARYPILG